MNEFQIKKPQELFDAVNHAEGLIGQAGHRLWWRGHTNSNWKLVPSVYRSWYSGDEQNLYSGFLKDARARFENPPPVDDVVSWLSLMQHHGLPTKLLDWTESILIAAFFCCASLENRDVDGAIWALKPHQLNLLQLQNGIIPDPYGEIIKKLYEKSFDRNVVAPEVICAINTHQTNLRMLIQQAHSTIHGLTIPIEELFNSEKFLCKFIIPKESKDAIAESILKFGFRESYIFPDLDHLANEVRGRFYISSKLDT